MYGIGLIVAGIAIYFKRTGTIVFLIQTALLFVTDTVPTSDAILKITHYIPLTRCNEILRQIAVGGEYRHAAGIVYRGAGVAGDRKRVL